MLLFINRPSQSVITSMSLQKFWDRNIVHTNESFRELWHIYVSYAPLERNLSLKEHCRRCITVLADFIQPLGVLLMCLALMTNLQHAMQQASLIFQILFWIQFVDHNTLGQSSKAWLIKLLSQPRQHLLHR